MGQLKLNVRIQFTLACYIHLLIVVLCFLEAERTMMKMNKLRDHWCRHGHCHFSWRSCSFSACNWWSVSGVWTNQTRALWRTYIASRFTGITTHCWCSKSCCFSNLWQAKALELIWLQHCNSVQIMAAPQSFLYVLFLLSRGRWGPVGACQKWKRVPSPPNASSAFSAAFCFSSKAWMWNSNSLDIFFQYAIPGSKIFKLIPHWFQLCIGPGVDEKVLLFEVFLVAIGLQWRPDTSADLRLRKLRPVKRSRRFQMISDTLAEDLQFTNCPSPSCLLICQSLNYVRLQQQREHEGVTRTPKQSFAFAKIVELRKDWKDNTCQSI